MVPQPLWVVSQLLAMSSKSLLVMFEPLVITVR